VETYASGSWRTLEHCAYVLVAEPIPGDEHDELPVSVRETFKCPLGNKCLLVLGTD
jgi:hypothetical protein